MKHKIFCGGLIRVVRRQSTWVIEEKGKDALGDTKWEQFDEIIGGVSVRTNSGQADVKLLEALLVAAFKEEP